MLYANGNGAGEVDRVGEVLYNRGMLNAMFIAEGIKNAQAIHGTTELRGKHLRDGLEAMDITEARLAELGMGGFTPEVKVTCADHEGGGPVRIQQWNAADQKWEWASDWITPMSDVVRELVMADSAAYAAENNITPVDCN